MKYRKASVVRNLRGTRGLILVAAVLLALLAWGFEQGSWRAGGLLGTARSQMRPSELLQRVSLNRVGIEGNSDSFAPSISADGRYVVFLSKADNLVEGDTNGLQDVFLYDRTTHEIRRLSVGHEGSEADGPSSEAHISRDGRFVVFVSEAENLAPEDDNGYADVFLYDVAAQTVRMVSVSADGTPGDNRSLQPAISADGRFVAFVSLADALVAGDSNGFSDVFVYDATLKTLEMVSVSTEGDAADGTNKYPAISADGRFVVFQSKAGNLAANDFNWQYDIFLRDRAQNVTELISRSVNGLPGNMESQRPSLSDNGRFVAFESWASDLVEGDENYQSDVFVLDRMSGSMELVSLANDGAQADHVNGGAVISNDGRFVAFSSLAGNLAPNDYNQMFDVYLRDRLWKQTRLVSVNLQGEAANGASISPSLTAGGTHIVFDSVAMDLVPDDDNGRVDVFIFNGLMLEESPRPTLFLPFVAGS